MNRLLVFLVLGMLLTVLGIGMLAGLLRMLTAGGEVNALMLIPAAFALVGIVLTVVAARGLLGRRQRRAMPLAAVRAEPAASGASRWALVDVASGIARRLEGNPCSVHHAGERIEIRWAGEVAQHRCELRDAGDGELSHSDVIESAFEVRRLRRGVVMRAGPTQRTRVAGQAEREFHGPDRAAVHTAIDETLALAGWRREG